MKTAVLILGIVLAVNGKSVSSASPNDDALKNIAKNILNEIRDLETQVLSIAESSQVAVKERLLQIKSIKELQDALNNALKEESINVDCAASIDMGFFNLIQSVNDDLFQEAVKNVTDSEDFLKQSIQTLKDIKLTLTTSLDEEIIACKANESNCRLTGEFLKKTEELFRLVDLHRHKIVDLVKNSEYYESDVVKDKIQKELIAPSSCLQ